MTVGISAAAPASDPLSVLREYRTLAPWGLRDLAALAGGILDASNIVPVNAAARAQPSERTIRFYVARGLVSPPEGRGTAAVYSYRHLLHVLAIKLRQMEGASLDTIVKEFAGLTGDTVERRVAATIGASLPRPDRLPLLQPPGGARGRVGRALQGWLAPPPEVGASTGPSVCHRIPIGPGLELLVDDQHPLARLTDGTTVADAVRRAVGELLGEPQALSPP